MKIFGKVEEQKPRKIELVKFFVPDVETLTQLLNALAIAKNVKAVEAEKIAIGDNVILYGPDSRTLNTFVEFVKNA